MPADSQKYLYRSSRTQIPDAYRAGVAIAEELVEIQPEVLILFATSHYQATLKEIAEGIYDVLGTDVMICGGTGDGIYETQIVANHGVCAFGINSHAQVKWSLALEVVSKNQWETAAAAAARKAQAGLTEPATFAFVLADGIHADGSQVTKGLQHVFQIPCLGGLSADDRQFKSTAVLAGHQASEKAVVVLAASGNLPFRIHIASGWIPFGDKGDVTHAEGKRLYTINGVKAMDFISEQTGKRLGEMDLGVMALAETTKTQPDSFVLRSFSQIHPEDGSITFFGQVTPGAQIQICRTSPEDILNGVDSALAGINSDQFQTAAALIISCAGRKWLLSENGQEELKRVQQQLGDIPMIGFPSFGEIGPFRVDENYSPAYFHNVTFVLCAFGE